VGTPPYGDMGRLVGAGAAYFDSHASPERRALLRDNMARVPAGTPGFQTVFAQTPMRFFDPAFDARPLFADADIRPKMLMHLLGTLGLGWKVEGDPRALTVPWLLAHGRHDYSVPLSLWDDHLPGLPAARRVIFERSGHQPFVEEPERFAAVVGDWVAGIAARARE
jgi:proline iminopeptidase